MPSTMRVVLLYVAFSLTAAFAWAAPQRAAAREAVQETPLVTAALANDQIRFATLALTRRIRLQVVDSSGAEVFDSGLRAGNLLEWPLRDEAGSPLADGTYGSIVIVEDFSGNLSRRQGVFEIRSGRAYASGAARAQDFASADQEELLVLGAGDPAPITVLSHDGTEGWVESGHGGLSLSAGRLSRDRAAVPQLRISPEGSVGIGTAEPEARLDVRGLIRTSEGIVFPDGTVQRSAARVSVAVLPGDRASAAVTAFSADGRLGNSAGTTGSASGQKGAETPVPYLAGTGGPGQVYGTEGTANTYYGFNAGNANFVAGNSFFGVAAGNGNATGLYNTYLGDIAGTLNTSGSRNAVVGASGGSKLTSGNDNTLLGYNAGNTITTEWSNSLVGAYSDVAAGVLNASAIGFRAKATQNNSLVLGSINGLNSAAADTNVGIGTSAPAGRLHVKTGTEDNLFIGSNSRVGIGTVTPDKSLQIVSTPAGYATLHIGGTGDEWKDVYSGMGPNIDIGPGFNFGYSGSSFGRGSGFFNVRPDASAGAPNPSLRFMTVNQQRMIITNTGNVGIGTSNPTERLHVIGNLRVSGQIVYGAPEDEIPDYVFEPDYDLMPIEEVGKFVEREKHLPNIPAAGEIKQNGLNLGDFQMKLLRQIEELTLYTVQQAKAMGRKDAEIEELKAGNAALGARLAALEQALERLTDKEQK